MFYGMKGETECIEHVQEVYFSVWEISCSLCVKNMIVYLNTAKYYLIFTSKVGAL